MRGTRGKPARRSLLNDPIRLVGRVVMAAGMLALIGAMVRLAVLVDVSGALRGWTWLTAGVGMVAVVVVAGYHLWLARAHQRLLFDHDQAHRLALVAQNIPNAVVILDHHGRIVWVNASFERMTGYSLDDVRDRKPASVLHVPMTEPGGVRQFLTFMRKRRTIQMETVGYTRGGDELSLYVELHPLPEEQGQPGGFLGIATDVTERRRMESLLRHERERLDLALSGAELGTWDWNPQTGEMRFDSRWAAMIGEDIEGLRGCRDQWCGRLHPDDQMDVQKKLQEHFDGQSDFFEATFRMRHHDGTWRWILGRGRVVCRDREGRPTRLVGTQMDVTAEREAMAELARTRQHLEDAINAIGAALAMYDAEDRLVFCNQQYRWLYWQVREEIKPGMNLGDLLDLYARRYPAILKGQEREAWVQHRLDQHHRAPSEWEQLLEGQWIRVSDRPTADGGVVSLRTDITNLKQIQSELSTAKEEAEIATRVKSQFLANMSHEIRTPLTAIVGYAELLEDEAVSNDPRRRIDAVTTIRRASDHLLTIVNDVLDLSRIEAGRLEPERVEVDLPDLLSAIVALMQPRAAGKGVSLGAKLLTEIPTRIWGDPTRLRQILLNLVGNAVKFTEYGEVAMEVAVVEQMPSVSAEAKLHQPDGPRQWLKLEVRDTGVGMSAAQAQRSFEWFVQADASMTRKHGGSGLGLTISRRLAQLLGGNVELVWTREGQGSLFRFYVPLESTPSATLVAKLPDLDAPVRQPAASTSSQIAGRVLLAEDGKDNRNLIALILRRAGADVDTAENGRIALDMIHEAQNTGKPYRLLVTDMQMPEMDGYTLATTLRNEGCIMPIIALTAHAMAHDRDRCLRCGCDDYARKPVNQSALLQICNKLLNPSKRDAAA
ncbi:MAG: PAS domain S-box protein [Phycisphaeraceae bacterium]|nr:PAS domain S-box protein [Phycisphaeraceae bacterium]